MDRANRMGLRVLPVVCLALAAAVFVTDVRPAGAGADPALVCAAVKQKAAFKKAAKRGACYAKATKDGSAVDPACLQKVEDKFASQFAKAEGKGGCATTGDAAAIESTVDGFVTQVVTAIRTTVTIPCGGVTPSCFGECPPGKTCYGGGMSQGSSCSCQ